MLDMATGDPRLQQLIDKIVAHTQVIVRNYLRIGVDVMGSPMIWARRRRRSSAENFRRWIKPAYTKLMAPARPPAPIVGFHSDSYTLDILEDQVAAGVDIVNPKTWPSIIDNLARTIREGLHSPGHRPADDHSVRHP